MDYIELALVAAPGAAGCALGYAAVRHLAFRSIASALRLDSSASNRIFAALERLELPVHVAGLRVLVTYGVLLGVLVSGALLHAPMWSISVAYGIALPLMFLLRFSIAKPYYVREILKQMSGDESGRQAPNMP